MAMSNGYRPNFLGMCSGIALTESTIAGGQINIFNWNLAHKYLKPILILEALHQFSVRLATAVAKNTDPSYRYLPVMVEQFTSVADFDGDMLNVEGDIELVNDAYRIHCKASLDGKDSVFIAQATIIVSRVYLPESASEKPSFLLTDDLCKVSTLARDFYTFYFDANHLLFEEHFPCRAVCPGSLLIDMVVSIISKTNAGSVAFIELEKVKFIEAVYPGKKYLLTIKHDTESDSNGVFYIHTESKKRFTCGRFSIKYKECDAICLTL